MATWNRSEHWAESRDRLRWAGRDVDTIFLPSEGLFLRYNEPLLQGRVPPTAIRCPDDRGTSCNRMKYSDAQDVLFPSYYHMGVCKIEVQQLPTSLESGTGITLSFSVSHDPTTVVDDQCQAHVENYAHTLMYTVNANTGTVRKKSQFNSTLKTLVRTVLSEGMRVISEPVSAHQPVAVLLHLESTKK